MKDLYVDTEEPICAIATPLAPSALGIVRFCGKNSLQLFSQVFSRPQALRNTPHRGACHGSIRDQTGADVDDVVVLVWREGGGYTGQEGGDIMAHGNPTILLGIVEVLTRSGFRSAGPGEFTLRAFLNGKLDLTQAEAVDSLIKARTTRAAGLALKRLHGGIRREIEEAKQAILDQLAQVNIQLDYAEDDVETMKLDRVRLRAVLERLESLVATSRRGSLYQEGLRVALVGPVNAGKSSLFNRFLQEERSIVSEEAGTTRDFLEGWISLEGIPLKLFDTAGLRETDNRVEHEGIRRSRDLAAAADLVLFVWDGLRGLPKTEESFEKPTIKVWNKVDVAPEVPETWIGVSAKNGLGWRDLIDALKTKLKELEGGGAQGDLSLDSQRQAELLSRAARSLHDALDAEDLDLPHDMIALDLQDALDALGEITGEVTTADVLNRMFGSFCVGK